ncbi:unnamed protein product, partial [Discosporangium mesarthrocarpum]
EEPRALSAEGDEGVRDEDVEMATIEPLVRHQDQGDSGATSSSRGTPQGTQAMAAPGRHPGPQEPDRSAIEEPGRVDGGGTENVRLVPMGTTGTGDGIPWMARTVPTPIRMPGGDRQWSSKCAPGGGPCSDPGGGPGSDSGGGSGGRGGDTIGKHGCGADGGSGTRPPSHHRETPTDIWQSSNEGEEGDDSDQQEGAEGTGKGSSRFGPYGGVFPTPILPIQELAEQRNVPVRRNVAAVVGGQRERPGAEAVDRMEDWGSEKGDDGSER